MAKRCKIVPVGKRRNGTMRYWCLAHRADASGRGGKALSKCSQWDVRSPTAAETLTIDPTKYRGGVAVWGAVAPVYSTVLHDEPDIGVHVHARRQTGGKKGIDRTFQLVRVVAPKEKTGNDYIEIGRKEATQYLIASIFGRELSFVRCTHCEHPHLDEDWFCVNPHRKHQCFGCGKDFFASEKGIGNPLVGAQEVVKKSKRERKPIWPRRRLEVSQSDFELGIELWGSNPAILWTSPIAEEKGIHFHGYTENVYIPSVDETFDCVVIDGLSLEVEPLRFLMAQNHLPHLAGRIVSLLCPRCGAPHFDQGELAFTPHKVHVCDCGAEFVSPGRKKLVVSNPMLETLCKLEQAATLKRNF